MSKLQMTNKFLDKKETVYFLFFLSLMQKVLSILCECRTAEMAQK